MHPASATLPAGDHLDNPRLVLRDGTAATVRRARAADGDAIRRFFHELSPESREKRFFSSAEPSAALIASFSDDSNPARALTLIVERQVGADLRPIAVAGYIAINERTAEAAFAVDDRFQGKGLGSTLLEWLAVLASHHGIERFEATTLADNVAMLEVFRDSGFEIRSKTASGCVELRLSLVPSAAGVRLAESRDRAATAASLRPMLAPRAVAVVGVSREESSLGRRVFSSLKSGVFKGPIYPVNAKASEIDGVRCYASARDLPAGVELAVIAVPSGCVLNAVDDCAAAAIPSIVVVSAGFAEAGESGRGLQDRLVARVRNHGMRMVGPNCMGLLNAGIGLNASFSPIMPPAGHVALSSQSGALGMAILELATEREVGLSTFVSVGNKGDVSGNDLLQYWEGDPETAVILLYLESFGNPRRFVRLARRVGRAKPIVAVKAGRTRAGRRAAGSHTAALAANEAGVQALFQQSGVIRADTIDEMFDVAACLDAQPLPAGRRVAIVTNAGGPGILAVDACEAAGLTVVEFGDTTRQRLGSFLPPEASIANPVDMIASAGPDEYRRAIEVALSAEEADALIVIFTPVERRTSAAILAAIGEGIAAGRRSGAVTKPVLACVMAEPGTRRPLTTGAEKIPTYAFPENAARALGKIAAYAEWRGQAPALFWSFEDIRPAEARDLCETILASRGNDWLTPEETQRVLHAFGLPLMPTILTRTADDAAALAAVVGFPVVAKLQAKNVLHKSDIGGVRVNLANARAVRSAFKELTELAAQHGANGPTDGVVIQPMVTGVETMIGVTEDPLFGPLIAFGLGGVNVEVLSDVQFRIAPLSDRDADALLHGIHGFPLLQGYRGHPPADLDALRELLLRVSRLAEEVPAIAELDLNPVMALPPGRGCRIVDARIRIAR